MPSKVATKPPVGSRLTFHRDWQVTQSGPLVSGQPIEIQYAAERLHAVAGGKIPEGERNGWTITGYFSVDGGPAVTFSAASQSSAEAVRIEPQVEEHKPGALQVWFEVNDLYGQSHYDSDFGKNYQFKIYPRVVLSQSGVADYVGSLDKARTATV